MEIDEVAKLKHEFQTIKLWQSTYKLIKLVAALTGESMVVLFHRLILDELVRVKKKELENGSVGK